MRYKRNTLTELSMALYNQCMMQNLLPAYSVINSVIFPIATVVANVSMLFKGTTLITERKSSQHRIIIESFKTEWGIGLQSGDDLLTLCRKWRGFLAPLVQFVQFMQKSLDQQC